MKLRMLLGGLAAGSLAMVAARAQAAPAPVCTPAAMSPVASTVPANLPGFAYTALAATPADVHLFITSGGARTEVPVTLGPVADAILPVKPTAALLAGTSYELEFKSFCDYGPYPAQAPIAFTVTDAAPLPTKLGDASAAPTVSLKDFGTTQYTVTGAYTLDADMKPWLGAYQLVVVVDGVVTETKATVAATQDRVQVTATGWCDAATAARKHHEIVLRGRLPFTPAVDSTATNVDFDCPAPNITTPPNVAPTPPDPTAPTGGTTTPGMNVRSGGCSAVLIGENAGVSSTFFGLALAAGVAFRVRRRLTAAAPASRRR